MVENEETVPGTEAEESLLASSGRPWWQWLSFLAAGLPLLLLVLLPPTLWFLSETAAGRALVAQGVGVVRLQSGMHFTVGRIEGSLFSDFTLENTVVHDLDGPLVTIPEARVSWKPRALLGGVFSFNNITVPEATLLRLPHLNPSNPNEPLLPDIRLDIREFALRRVILAPAVVGSREELAASGEASIRHGRLITHVRANSTAGDRLLVRVNAVPEANRLDLATDLAAPAKGVLMRLVGIEKPLAVHLAGKGSWEKWRGALKATLASESLGQLAIAADSGRFHLTGQVVPAPFLPEAAVAAFSPALAIDFTGTKVDNWLVMALKASTPAFTLTSHGKLDPSHNQLQDVQAKFVVADSSRLTPGLVARDLQLEATANGRLAGPDAALAITAGLLRYGPGEAPIGVAGLQASANLKEKRGRFTLPFHASAKEVLGLSPENAALLAHPDITGTLQYAGGTLTLEALKADTAAIKADVHATLLESGKAKGALKATLKRYTVPGFGVLTGNVDASFTQAPGKDLPLVGGSFAFKALTLEAGQAQRLFETPPSLGGRFALDEAQRLTLGKVALRSNGLTLGASGHYALKSESFALTAQGASHLYGPFALKGSGTLLQPFATLSMANPDFGIGLRALVAHLSPDPEGYKLVFGAESPQGPLAGDVRIGYAPPKPLLLDIRALSFAELAAHGRLQQTAAGPFTGALTVTGKGLEAAATLTAAGAVQGAKIHGTARDARLPTPGTPTSIGSGNFDFVVALPPAGPRITGGFNFQNVRQGTLLLTKALGRVDMQGLAGTASATIEGKSGQKLPFTTNARLASTATGYQLGLNGRVGKLDLALAEPARILRLKNGWELLPATLKLQRGTVVVSGKMAGTTTLNIGLNNVSLRSVNQIDNEMGLSGTLNGSATLAFVKGTPIPTGQVRLAVRRLSRGGVTGISMPVDVVAAADLKKNDIKLGARFSSRDRQLGRLLLGLNPAARGSLVERLMNGSLSGGFRYNGSLEPLWALAAPDGQELRGALALGVDFAGTPANPVMNGVTHGRNIVYQNTAFGTRIDNISLDGHFSGASFTLTNLAGRAGKGSISGKGTVSYTRANNLAVDLAVTLDHATLAKNEMVDATLSGPLQVKGQKGTFTLSGNLDIDKANVVLAPFSTNAVTTVKVRRVGETAPPPETVSLDAIGLDMRIRSKADGIRVEGMGLDSFWGADIRVRGTAANPQLLGRTTMDHGTFTFASSDFKITTGRLTFNGAPMESAINLQAQTQAQDVTAVIRIAGTAARPQVSFTSTPTLPEDEILSRLLFGSSVANLSITEAVQLASAVNGLRTGGIDTIGKMRRSIGLDQLKLVGGENGMGAGIAVGKKLMKDVYVEVVTDTQGHTLTQLQFTLTRLLSLFTEVSSIGKDSINLRYQREH